jgi:hypothetical protein
MTPELKHALEAVLNIAAPMNPCPLCTGGLRHDEHCLVVLIADRLEIERRRQR